MVFFLGLIVVMLMVTVIVARVYRQRLLRTMVQEADRREREGGNRSEICKLEKVQIFIFRRAISQS